MPEQSTHYAKQGYKAPSAGELIRQFHDRGKDIELALFLAEYDPEETENRAVFDAL